jgi:hypothetical protein
MPADDALPPVMSPKAAEAAELREGSEQVGCLSSSRKMSRSLAQNTRCFSSRPRPLNTLLHLCDNHSLPHTQYHTTACRILTSSTTGCLCPPRIHPSSPPAPSKASPLVAAPPPCAFLRRHHTAVPPPPRASAPPRPRCSFRGIPSPAAAAAEAQGKKTTAPPKSHCCSNRARSTWVGPANGRVGGRLVAAAAKTVGTAVAAAAAVFRVRC